MCIILILYRPLGPDPKIDCDRFLFQCETMKRLLCHTSPRNSKHSIKYVLFEPHSQSIGYMLTERSLQSYRSCVGGEFKSLLLYMMYSTKGWLGCYCMYWCIFCIRLRWDFLLFIAQWDPQLKAIKSINTKPSCNGSIMLWKYKSF